QDFKKLRDLCLSRQMLFEDSTFPADIRSIGATLFSEETLRQIQWKRPTEIERNPYLIKDGASRGDVMQGRLGDCWALAALGSLTLRQKFLKNVLPMDQGFQDNYAGIFHFRFWQYGKWVDVVIDDRLPFLNGECLAVRPRTSDEYWPPLLEKAYAKLYGSYKNLKGGYISNALVDFTGGFQVGISLQKPPHDLEEILKAAYKSHCFMGCSTLDQVSHRAHHMLLLFVFLSFLQIPYKNGWTQIIRIWNPWGHGEWTGPWSDNSSKWDHVEPKYREELLIKKNDGEFW
ncbi:CAN13 protein, partial [Spelaeornis formosus]|nr:CAN13 protein [Elachura formosa]